MTYFSNSYTETTSSLSTRGQLPVGQVTLTPPAVTLLLLGQYAAAENCSNRLRFAKSLSDIAKAVNMYIKKTKMIDQPTSRC